MEQIEKYNCEGLCMEQFCGERYTRFRIIEVFGMKLTFSFCDKHAEQFELNEQKIIEKEVSNGTIN
jgi:hypothetical protein